jgi:ATP/maltotriose-dependent transcriptional regulator MalT
MGLSSISKETSTDGSLKIILNNIKPSIQKGKVMFIWGASLDVSNLFKAQEDLKRSEKKLKKQKRKLEKKNIALKELIVHIGLDKKEFKDRISANIQHLVLPSLDKMALNGLKEESIEQHRKTLENITSSFGLKMSDNRVKLSPREIEVCNFVKNGLSSKEISRLLNIALHTVEKHRRMARS